MISRTNQRTRLSNEYKTHIGGQQTINDVQFYWDGYSNKIDAVVKGPKNSLYEGGHFKLMVIVPNNYPFCPPEIKLLTKLYHPGVEDPE